MITSYFTKMFYWKKMAVAYKERTVKQGSQKTEKETMKENKDKNKDDKNKEK